MPIPLNKNCLQVGIYSRLAIKNRNNLKNFYKFNTHTTNFASQSVINLYTHMHSTKKTLFIYD